MAANNSFHVLGNVGKDPEMQYLPNEKGTALVTFSVAVQEGFGNQKKTHWFNCSMFGKRAEAFNEYVKGGRAVALEGTLNTYERTLEDGRKVSAFGLKVTDWAFAGSEGNGGGGQRQGQSRGNQQGGGYRGNNGGGQRGNWNRGDSNNQQGGGYRGNNGGGQRGNWNRGDSNNQQGGGYRGRQAQPEQPAQSDYQDDGGWNPPF